MGNPPKIFDCPKWCMKYLQRWKAKKHLKMKKVIFGLIAIVIFGNNSFSQNTELLILKNKNEVSFLLKNSDGKFDENYIFQTDEVSKFELNSGIVSNFKLIYDKRALIINIEKNTYYFIVDNYIIGKNVIKGYGLSKRKGVFEIINNDENKSYFETIREVNARGGLSCTSGGTGSTECSVTSTIGPLGTGCSVGCGVGYYACCDDNTVVCKCLPNPKIKSLQESRLFSIKLNPVTSNLEFEGKEFGNYEIEILSFSGQKVIINQKLTTKVDIDSIDSGIYIYRIKNSSNIYLIICNI
jgi:hypothetical protein